MIHDVREIVEAYANGGIDREEYWRAMRDVHETFDRYRCLVRGPVLEAIEIRGTGVDVRLKNGLRLAWNPSDIRTAPSILVNHGEYEPDEMRLLEVLARHCSVAFDIGANVGWYAVHLGLWLRARAGHVYAFEPVPTTFAQLEKNIASNSLGAMVSASALALGETVRGEDVYLPAFSGSVAASRRPLFPEDENTRVPVHMTTIDLFMAEEGIDRIDLVKCDVEGSELLVLKGGLETLERNRPAIMMEMLRKWSAVYDYHPNDIISLLSGLGYECWTVLDGKMITVAEVDEAATQTNFYFLHPVRHSGWVEELDAALSGPSESR